jgi:acetolactate decarboxylase
MKQLGHLIRCTCTEGKMIKSNPYFWCVVFLIILGMCGLPTSAQLSRPPSAGFQISTLGALNLGLYEGAATLADLKQHGDFGLGTFAGLDGEMVVLAGQVYQIKADGRALAVVDQVKTPFAAVTFFRRDRALRLAGTLTYQDLQQQISKQLPTANLPYAIRIEGTFPALQVRSVPPQKLPYLPLGEVVKQQQRVFELRQVRGTLVGFRLPAYFKAVNVAGYHFHFITSDRKTGGHVLAGEFLHPLVEVQTLPDWQIKLPQHDAFAQALLE